MSGVRLAELLASLSLATDLGLGLPQEHVLRQTLLADRIAELAGFDDAQRCSVVHVSLMAWVGCVADSHEMAHWYDDDLALRAASYEVDKAGLPMMRFMVGHLADRDGSFGRVGTVAAFLTRGARQVAGGFVAHCQTTGDIAERVGVEPAVRRARAVPHRPQRPAVRRPGAADDPDANFRALLPPRTLDGGPELLISSYRTWFGGPSTVVATAAETAGARLSVAYSVVVDDDRPRQAEQHLYLTVLDGRISAVDLICSGFHAVTAARAA